MDKIIDIEVAYFAQCFHFNKATEELHHIFLVAMREIQKQYAH